MILWSAGRSRTDSLPFLRQKDYIWGLSCRKVRVSFALLWWCRFFALVPDSPEWKMNRVARLIMILRWCAFCLQNECEQGKISRTNSYVLEIWQYMYRKCMQNLWFKVEILSLQKNGQSIDWGGESRSPIHFTARQLAGNWSRLRYIDQYSPWSVCAWLSWGTFDQRDSAAWLEQFQAYSLAWTAMATLKSLWEQWSIRRYVQFSEITRESTRKSCKSWGSRRL